MSKKAYCGRGCMEAYRSDRRHGLVYGSGAIRAEQLKPSMYHLPYPNEPSLVIVGWEDYCAVNNQCRYCRTELH